MVKTRLALLALAMLAALPAAISAQDAPPVLADNLHAPRHIFLSDDSLYVVEAGAGGETPAESPFGTLQTGTSGQVTVFDKDGKPSPFITGLFSSLSETGEVTGPHAVYVDENAAWVLVGQGVPDLPEETPGWALLQYSADGTTLEDSIDLLSYEETENPDGGEIDSNPVDLAVAEDGAVYVADAGANAVLKIVDGEISTFAVWTPVEGEPQAVPTSLEIDSEGNVYVGFLTGFPFPVGGAWVEKLSPEGESLERYDGLTMVVDIALDENEELYAVQFGEFTEQGPLPGSGQIVKISSEGVEPVVTGLMFPYGFIVNKDGSFVVANGASFLPAGQLLYVQPGTAIPAADVPPPATTEEAE